jgi:integrase
MTLKQAKILSDADIDRLLRTVRHHRHALRDRVMILLSIKAGLRAGEIAKLTWPMVLDSQGKIGTAIELHNRAAKKGSGRVIPIHPALQKALGDWLRYCCEGQEGNFDWQGNVIVSERGDTQGMRASSVVTWFATFYRKLGLIGCSSHSGRRTFVTKAARIVHRAGGSLRDVQQLAGHRSIEMTQRYIEGDTQIQRRLVQLL